MFFYMFFFFNETSYLECSLDEYQKKFRCLEYVDKLGDCPKLKPKPTCLRCVLPRLTLLKCTLFKFIVLHVIAYPYWNWPKLLPCGFGFATVRCKKNLESQWWPLLKVITLLNLSSCNSLLNVQ